MGAGWQGKTSPAPTQNISRRIVAQSTLERSVRAFLANGTTGNLEAMRRAVEELDRC